jgi:hypothetical protein
MEELEITLEQFIKDNGITAEFKHDGLKTELEKNREGKKEPHTMDGWQVTLTMAGKTMQTTYRTGLGHRTPNRGKIANARGFWANKQEMEQMKQKAMMSRGGDKWLIDFCDHKTPEAQDILDCLASDSSSYDNARNFEDFCSDFGYDEDSRSAEKIYNACGAIAKELKFFLGAELYEVLLYKVERL